MPTGASNGFHSMRIMGIDWGKVRLGLALSDPSGLIATPLEPIKRKGDKHDIGEIIRIASDKDVDEIVVGIPLDIKGEFGKTATAVKAFAGKIEEVFEGAVHLVDERYSTQASQRSMIEADLSRKRRKELRDGAAAAWILQGFLDSRN